MEKLHFASDYMEGAHPAVLAALCETNAVSTPGYGTDVYCSQAAALIREACGCPGTDWPGSRSGSTSAGFAGLRS